MVYKDAPQTIYIDITKVNHITLLDSDNEFGTIVFEAGEMLDCITIESLQPIIEYLEDRGGK
jgi:hypothetical protein